MRNTIPCCPSTGFSRRWSATNWSPPRLTCGAAASVQAELVYAVRPTAASSCPTPRISRSFRQQGATGRLRGGAQGTGGAGGAVAGRYCHGAAAHPQRRGDARGVGRRPVPAQVRREVPGASRNCRPRLWEARAGARSRSIRATIKGITTLKQVFQLELSLPGEVRSDYLGARVFVRFNHGYEPAGFQIYRAFRRLLLRQFNV
jgi:hypothetical protein